MGGDGRYFSRQWRMKKQMFVKEKIQNKKLGDYQGVLDLKCATTRGFLGETRGIKLDKKKKKRSKKIKSGGTPRNAGDVL